MAFGFALLGESQVPTGLVECCTRSDNPVVARRRTPDRRDSLASPPPDLHAVEVQVTVLPGPDENRVRDRDRWHAGPRARVTAGLAVVVAVGGVGAVVIGALRGGRTGPSSPVVVARARTAAPAGVAAAYRYPLGCLSVTISARNPAYAGAHLDRASPCWRYGVYVTAILHRVHGVWRLALEAAGSSCPAVSLPAVVLAQLAVCRRRRNIRTRAGPPELAGRAAR